MYTAQQGRCTELCSPTASALKHAAATANRGGGDGQERRKEMERDGEEKGREGEGDGSLYDGSVRGGTHTYQHTHTHTHTHTKHSGSAQLCLL